jgi:cytochrome P450
LSKITLEKAGPVLVAELSSFEYRSVDITAASFKANPFPFYAHLRSAAPVFPISLPRYGRSWLVTRYDDVMSVLRDDRHFVKDRRLAAPPEQPTRGAGLARLFEPLQRNLLSLEGGDHRRLRALVQKAFTPSMIEQLRSQVQVVADRALDRVQPARRMDLVADFALPVPLTMIGRILGVPERDQRRFSRWTRAFVSVGGSRFPILQVPSMLRFMRYLRKLIAERRGQPADDLISGLVLAQEADDRLTDDEVLAMVFLLLSAGHETTLNLIGSGALALLEHPDQCQRLRAEPELSVSAVEELVRFVAPVETATQRYALEDTMVASTHIPRGELVLAVIASANRDSAVFDDPDVLDISRSNNKHLGFGQGVHYCLGAPLARLEGQVALGTLLRRAPDLRLAVPPEELRWRSTLIVRGLKALPVTF